MVLLTLQSLTETLLPSLAATNVWAYWIIAAAALLEAFFLTGLILPGTLLVDLGGVLVHRGMLDLVDLLWFVAIGSWIGSYGSFWSGQRLASGRRGRSRFASSRLAALAKAQSLLRRHGAMAVLFGRFTGPAAGLVPFAAGLSGMGTRRFLVISALGAIPYAIVHVVIGYGASEAFGRLSPALTREVVAIAAVLLMLALLWYVLARLIGVLPLFGVVLAAAWRGVSAEPVVARWITAHPRLASVVAARLRRGRFDGLPLTLMTAALLVLGTLWVGATLDYLSGDPIIRADRNIVSLLHVLQTPVGLRIAAHVTAIGDWRSAVALLAAAGLALWLRGERALALGAVVAVAGQSVMVSLLKHLIGRERPSLAHFAETSASFPSGHAALSAALFGYVAHAFWRAGVLRLQVLAPLAGLAILSVGFSRMYLGEHYLSDVINGFLVGSIWLVLGIAVGEGLRQGRLPPVPPRNGVARLAILPLVAVAALVVTFYDKPLAPLVPPAPPAVLHAAAELVEKPGFEPYAESLIGMQVEPISLILIAPDVTTLTAAFREAGWDQPATATLAQLAEAALAAWTNRHDPVAPITPYFRDGRPNDLAFQKPDGTDSLRRRHHMRLWRTGARLSGGQEVFLATASFDDGLKWGLVHHISPDLDAERDAIVKGLEQAGVLEIQSVLGGNGPLSGADEFGDPWYSDGQIVIANVKPAG